MHKIVVCMGSSCFARGNKENLQIIQQFLEENGLMDSVKLEGTLCMGLCGGGPNISIDGKDYHEVRPDELSVILHTHIPSP